MAWRPAQHTLSIKPLLLKRSLHFGGFAFNNSEILHYLYLYCVILLLLSRVLCVVSTGLCTIPCIHAHFQRDSRCKTVIVYYSSATNRQPLHKFRVLLKMQILHKHVFDFSARALYYCSLIFNICILQRGCKMHPRLAKCAFD